MRGLSMNTSPSQDDLKVELRVTRLLSDLAAEDPEHIISASSVSSALDISAAVIRRTLSNLAIRGLLKPKLVMVCTKCGTDNEDVDETESPSTEFCHVCAAQELHTPIVVFEFGDALRGRASPLPPGNPKSPDDRTQPNDPKLRGRKGIPRLLRPWTWFGVLKRRPKTA